MNTSLALDDINSIAQILALGLAGAFFFYRMVSGYFVVDLSLTLSAIREPHYEQGDDHLVVVAHIKRGERGASDHQARHVAEAVAAVGVTLADDELTRLAEPYTPRRPEGF